MGIDITRDSFDPSKSFTRVLMQQGRVQLDADWNEQNSIFWHFLQTLTRDLLGPYAGPKSNCGFAVIVAADLTPSDHPELSTEEQNRLRQLLRDDGDFLIGPGHYYVEGLLCINEEYVRYTRQSHMQKAPPLRATSAAHLIYLDVWEGEVSPLEDPSMREVALNGADTAHRARLHWQVRSFELKSDDKGDSGADWDAVKKDWGAFTEHWQSKNRGALRVRTLVNSEDGSPEPTTVAPNSAYRGTQNQLYRVEVHHPGSASSKDGATFKWSRENGSVAFPIDSFADPVVTAKNLGRDARSGVQPGDWVEISDDDSVYEHAVQSLRQVESVDFAHSRITLSGKTGSSVGTRADRHPLLRRWDHKQGDPRKGGLELREGAAIIREGDKSWLKLENGLQVQFEASEPVQHYRRGDYWLIPARTATGNVEWPQKGDEPRAIGPHGIMHHYGPLAIVTFEGSKLRPWGDFRLKFEIPSEY